MLRVTQGLAKAKTSAKKTAAKAIAATKKVKSEAKKLAKPKVQSKNKIKINPNLGENKIMDLLAAMDSSIEVPKREVDKDFMLSIEGTF